MADLCGPSHSSGNVPENIGITGGTGPGTAGGAFVPSTGPRLLEWSQMDVSCRVQHENTVPCDGEQGGTIARNSHSRFRVAHGLSATPQEVIVMRMSVVAHDGVTEMMEDDRNVTDSGYFGGFNPVKFHDSTAYALTCVNTSAPIADARYSYFTVGFPAAVYALLMNSNSNVADMSTTLPEYCGNLLTAVTQRWWGEQTGSGFGTETMQIRIDNTTCPITTTHGSGGPYVYGHPLNGVSFRPADIQGTGDAIPYLASAFLGIPNGSTVTVRVISRLWDAPTKRGIFTSPGPEAHPAP